MPGKRGFAAMDKEAQRAIASKGGRAAHARGTAHEFTPEEAAEAGRKGGRAVSTDRRHMAEIGRKGGKAAHSHQEPISVAPTPSTEQMPAANSQTLPTNGQPQMPNGHMANGHMANGQMPNGHTVMPGSQQHEMANCQCLPPNSPMPAQGGEQVHTGS